MADHSNTHKYFHDRFVLLALTINVFITVVCITTIFLRLGDTGSSYIQSFRDNLGINAYSVGGVGEIISFAVFAVAILVGQVLISLRLHPIRKRISWIVMVMGTLLLVLCTVVSNALLQLR